MLFTFVELFVAQEKTPTFTVQKIDSNLCVCILNFANHIMHGERE